MDAMPVAIASTYTSLDDVNGNIMILATVTQTWTRNIIATFHENVEKTQATSWTATFSDYIAMLPEHICQPLITTSSLQGEKESWRPA
jgi:hypothetical protein